MSPDQPHYLSELQKQIDEHFNLEDIRELVFELNIDFEHLAGDTKPTKISSLLLHLAKKGELDSLLDALRKHRPHVNWSDISLPTREQQKEDARFIGLSLPSREQIAAHLQALTEMNEYAKWAETSPDEHYIAGQSKMLPLLASPYDNLGSQQTALISTMREQERVLVLGEPGMGKTVALQRMVWETAKTGERMPLFVRLQQFRGNLKESLRVALSATGQLVLNDNQDVQLFLRELPCLILLDGLNEIPGHWREEAIGEIGDLLTEFPQQCIIVTSRVQDELWKRLHKGEIVNEAVVVQRITDEQARAYLAAHMGEEKGQLLYERLNDRLRGLVHTPLFLWMMKEAGLSDGEMPGNQGELIASFVNKSLRREQKIPSTLSAAVKKQALSQLAFTVQKRHELDFSTGQAQAIITEAQLGEDTELILAEVLRHGLLEGEDDHLRFMHQSIQENFVAQYLMGGRLDDERETAAWRRKMSRWRGRSEFADWVNDDWWAESFLQLAGLTAHNSWLAREVLHVKPWLAFWCVTEGLPVDDDTQTLVDAKTIAQFDSQDPLQRLNALRELGRFENPRIIPYLLEAMKDEDDEVMQLGVELLIRMGTVAEKPLLEFFKNELVIMRIRVADVLAQLGDPRPGVGVGVRDGLTLPDIAWGGEVPAGTYEIGGDLEAKFSFPRQEVMLKRQFQLARYPITNAQFQCFTDAPDVADARWWMNMPPNIHKRLKQRLVYTNHPCDEVTWYQAVAFCRWLSDKLGIEVDLPHEYEWEVAARYPDGRFYPWGDKFDADKKANRGKTTAVGLFSAGVQSQLGLYDMSGNVWEWCSNQFSDPEYMTVDNSDSTRVMRGGAWTGFHNRHGYERLACRLNGHPNHHYYGRHVGFRCMVRSP